MAIRASCWGGDLTMKEAKFYQKKADGSVICQLCHQRCRIGDGRRGICGVRENQQGTLYSLVYGRMVAEHIDPIEKKPLFHFLPSSKSYSISTVGCNFSCQHCQNYEISQYPHLTGQIGGTRRSPDEIITAAEMANCKSISYTYVEPTIFYEFAYDCATLAGKHGLKNVFVSNGYMTREVVHSLAQVLDGINIDIKAFTDKFYQQVCKAHLAPVLENVRLFHELGVWLEVTTLIIPGWNDSEAELREIATFIKDIDPEIPWHVTAFHPSFKMLDSLPTKVDSLRRAMEIGYEAGLAYVYCGNIPGSGGESTYCPWCKTLLIDRIGYQVVDKSRAGKCPSCDKQLALY